MARLEFGLQLSAYHHHPTRFDVNIPHNECTCLSLLDLSNACLTLIQNLDIPMEDDVLSDVVPSNIVSRQVRANFIPTPSFCKLTSWVQESEGGESEYDEEAGGEMEVDELESDGEKVSIVFPRMFDLVFEAALSVLV